MFPYITFNYLQYVLLLAVAIVFYTNTLNIIDKKKRIYPYIIQLIITIAIPFLTYKAQKMLSINSYPVMPYVIFSLALYVVLIIALKSFISIRNGVYYAKDIVFLVLIFITVAAILVITLKMQLTPKSLLIILLLFILVPLIYNFAICYM